MVAPQRAPHVRGIKCDLCRTILASMTWLDQTKLARSLQEAQNVIELIQKHDSKQCPCIPPDIRYLFLGSTYFELHRLQARILDDSVYQWQQDQLLLAHKAKVSRLKKKSNSDCNEYIGSRFECTFPPQISFIDEQVDPSVQQELPQYEKNGHRLPSPSHLVHIKHLKLAIDHWYQAISDYQVTFNDKLALRLGLTHHVIYSCYLFKYLKLLDYQLKSADLLVNLFQVVPAVTPNAIIHAHYLLIKTVLDIGFIKAAKNLMKSAKKFPTSDDYSNYESILFLTLECEIALIDSESEATLTREGSILSRLENVIEIKQEDKLQHYYARILARSFLMKYIRYFQRRSTICKDFFFVNRYLGAMMRRCYEESFRTKPVETSSPNLIVMDHKWIRFAICDIAFSSFEYVASFHISAGMPEQLELLFNGLYNVACRNASIYWILKLLLIGVRLDSLCHKGRDLNEKLALINLIPQACPDHLNYFLITLVIEREIMKISKSIQIVLAKDDRESLMNNLRRLQLDIFDKKAPLNYFVLEYQLVKYLSRTRVRISSFGDDGPDSNMMVHETRKNLLLNIKSQIYLLKVCGRDFEARAIFRYCVDIFSSHIMDLNEDKLLATMLLMVLNCDNAYLLKSIKSNPQVCHYRGPQCNQTRNSISSDSLNSKVSGLNLKDILSDSPFHPSSLPFSESRAHSVTRKRKNLSLSYLKNLSISLESDKPDVELLNHYFDLVINYPDFQEYRTINEFFFARRLELGLKNDETWYHLFESNSASSLRYRWMMYEEQFTHESSSTISVNNEKLLSFSINKFLKFDEYGKFLRSMPTEWRIVNVQYFFDESDKTEHLLVCRIERDSQPLLIHLEKEIEVGYPISVSSDSFESKQVALQTTIEKLKSYINRASSSLKWESYSSRTECRKKMEKEMRILLDDIDSDWFGPFKFLLLGRILEPDYQKAIDCMTDQLLSYLSKLIGDSSKNKISGSLLRSFLEGAPLLSREEFCLGIPAMLGEHHNLVKTKHSFDCFKIYTGLIEDFIAKNYPGYNKSTLLSNLPKGQLGLILNDSSLELPLETLPSIKVLRQPIFRVPSLRMFYYLMTNHATKINDSINGCCLAKAANLSYILDPEDNLNKTKCRFEDKLQSVTCWTGTIGVPPSQEQLKSWLTSKEIYLFIGHGAGTTYYNQLLAGHGLLALDVSPTAVVMGCSSAKMLSEGGQLERHGIGWNFILKGSPSYIGLLWDVTDTDIDRFLDSMMTKWIKLWPSDSREGEMSSTEAVACSRQVCKSSCLVGSAPVVYGLPIRIVE